MPKQAFCSELREMMEALEKAEKHDARAAEDAEDSVRMSTRRRITFSKTTDFAQAYYDWKDRHARMLTIARYLLEAKKEGHSLFDEVCGGSV